LRESAISYKKKISRVSILPLFLKEDAFWFFFMKRTFLDIRKRKV